LNREDEEEERKRQERRAWLGDPIEHGGGYRPAKPGWKEDIGCCLVEALGSSAFLILGTVSIYSLLS
jgi:hypothetical protein